MIPEIAGHVVLEADKKVSMAGLLGKSEDSLNWEIDPEQGERERRTQAAIVAPLTEENPFALIASLSDQPYRLNTFCLKCVALIDAFRLIDPVRREKLPGFNPTIPWYDQPLDLVLSAAKGCHLCSLSVGANGSCYRRLAAKQSPAHVGWTGQLKAITVGLTHTHEGEEPHPDDPICLVEQPCGLSYANVWWKSPRADAHEKIATAVQPEETEDEPPLPLYASTGHPDALQLCAWWLRKCLKEHSLCSNSSMNTRQETPTRLLDVDEQDEKSTIRLVSTQGLSAPSYCSLSYCWGKTRSVTLTTGNFESMTQSIKFTTLPRTIQDAVTVTRALGFRYLWVDALCIVQDLKEDWEKEAKKMAGIYRSSTLTIAALWAPGSDSGLFTNRNPLWFRTCQMLDSGFNISNGSNYMSREYLTVGSEHRASPLQTRGWVAQEHFSAPRTLYFGASGIMWECAQGEFHEADPTSTEGMADMRPMANLGNIGTRAKFAIAIFLDWYRLEKERLDSKDREELIAEFRDVWRVVLERYTACQLTYQSDRIPAITGLANMLSTTLNLTFCSGIWEDDVLHEILWKSVKPADVGHANKSSPTWSWASTTEAVQALTSTFLRSETTFLGIDKPAEETFTRSEPATVGASGYVLKLRAQLLEVELLQRSHPAGSRPALLRSPAMLKLVNDPRQLGTWWVPGAGHRPGHLPWMPDYEVPSDVTTAWCITIAIIENRSQTKAGIAGLIVLPIDEEKKMWMRIGMIKDKSYHDKADANPFLSCNNNDVEFREISLV